MRVHRLLLLMNLLALPGLQSAEPATPQPVELGATSLPTGYLLDEEGSLSPDGKYGVIYADSHIVDPEQAKNYLIARDPFRILAVTAGFSYFKPGNHREMAVEWTKDSSAVLVMIGGKWGTIAATLIELKEGKVTRQTDMVSLIDGLLNAKFPKGEVEPYNDLMNFILLDEKQFEFSEDGKTLLFDLAASNSPNLAGNKAWSGTFTGVWDVAAGKWLKKEALGKVFLREEQ